MKYKQPTLCHSFEPLSLFIPAKLLQSATNKSVFARLRKSCQTDKALRQFFEVRWQLKLGEKERCESTREYCFRPLITVADITNLSDAL